MRLLANENEEEFEPPTPNLSSYLAGASGFAGVARDIQNDVEYILPWLGETISKQVHELLAKAGATGVTLICCGPIALTPLHAAPWQDPSGYTCLLDSFTIRQAPSATVRRGIRLERR